MNRQQSLFDLCPDLRRPTDMSKVRRKPIADIDRGSRKPPTKERLPDRKPGLRKQMRMPCDVYRAHSESGHQNSFKLRRCSTKRAGNVEHITSPRARTPKRASTRSRTDKHDVRKHAPGR